MRLIDADALINAYCKGCTHYRDKICRAAQRCDFESFCNEYINAMPTIEAVPVRRGKWREYPAADGMNQCSVCGVLRFGESNYCPNCGARMDEE